MKSNAHISSHAPFLDVGDDSGNFKSIKRVEAIISYYLLAAGHLKELFRHKNFDRLFTKGFEEGCHWIANGGQRLSAAVSSRASIGNDTIPAAIAITRE